MVWHSEFGHLTVKANAGLIEIWIV